MTDFRRLLETLVSGGVEFVLVGGVAATVHGSVRLTRDVDVVYRRADENLRRLVSALRPIHPYLRGAPPGLPFRLDERTLRSGLNFNLTTDLGELDLLGEVAGGDRYESLTGHVLSVKAYGMEIPCVDLPTLIRLKRAAGRPRDLETVGELERLLEQGESDVR